MTRRERTETAAIPVMSWILGGTLCGCQAAGGLGGLPGLLLRLGWRGSITDQAIVALPCVHPALCSETPRCLQAHCCCAWLSGLQTNSFRAGCAFEHLDCACKDRREVPTRLWLWRRGDSSYATDGGGPSRPTSDRRLQRCCIRLTKAVHHPMRCLVLQMPTQLFRNLQRLVSKASSAAAVSSSFFNPREIETLCTFKFAMQHVPMKESLHNGR